MARKRAGATVPPAAMPAPDAPARDPRQPVTFAEAHTHRGVCFIKGDTYQATAEERELLRHFGVIEVA